MLQCVHPHCWVDALHARVRVDNCADIVAAYFACCAVGHDHQGHAAAHEVQSSGEPSLITHAQVERAGDGDYAAKRDLG